MNTTTTQSLVTFLHLLLHELQPTVLIVLDPRPTSVHPLCADLIEAAFTASRPAQVLGYRCEDRRYLANPRDSHWTQHGSADQRLAARLRIRLPFASVRTARVLCVHVCTDPDAAADDDQRTNRGGRSFYDATVSLLANRIGLPVHAMQHVVLAGRHSMAADANDGPAFRSVLQATTPLALLVECRSPTVHQRGVRVHSVVRADDFARVWSADEFAAALRRMAPGWRLNQRQPDVGHPMVVRLQSDLIACDPQSADRRRLAAIEQRWRMHAVSPFGARPPDGVAVGLYVLDRRHYGDEPPWLRRGYQMVVPNWWHWQPARRPTSRQLADDAVALVGVSHAAASTGVAFLALFALRWVLVQHRRHGIVERTAASTSAAGRFAWLLLDQWARSLGTSAPTARGETTLLAAGVALGCSGWGMWNAATLTGLSYRNSLADDDQLQWRPVFETLDDLRTHGGVLKVVSNEEGLQVAAQRWTKEIELVTAGRSEEVSFRDEKNCILLFDTNHQMLRQFLNLRHPNNQSQMMRVLRDPSLFSDAYAGVSPRWFYEHLNQVSGLLQDSGIDQYLQEHNLYRLNFKHMYDRLNEKRTMDAPTVGDESSISGNLFAFRLYAIMMLMSTIVAAVELLAQVLVIRHKSCFCNYRG